MKFLISIFVLLSFIPLTNAKEINLEECAEVINLFENKNINDKLINLLIDRKVNLNNLKNNCINFNEVSENSTVNYILAVIYREKNNLKLFEEFLLRALDNGIDAYDEVISLYYFGDISEKYSVNVDYNKAEYYMEKGATKMSADAMYHLGFEYKYGGIKKIDTKKANEYLKLSSEQGLLFSKFEYIDLSSRNDFETFKIFEDLIYSEELSKVKTTRAASYSYWWASIYANNLHDYPKAIKYINKTIELVTDRVGEKNEDLAYDYMLLSDVYNNAGAYDLSLKAINKSLEIHNHSGAQENSFLMQILTYKAFTLENLELEDESLELFRKIDNYYNSNPKDIFLADHITSQFKLADNYLKDGNINKAKEYLDLAEDGALTSMGEMPIFHLPIKIRILLADKKIDELNKYINLHLAGLKKSDIYSYAEALKIYSEHYYLNQNPEKCISNLDIAREIKSKIMTENNLNLIETNYILARCNQKLNNDDTSNKILSEIYKIYSNENNNSVFEITDTFINSFYHYLKSFYNTDYDQNDVFNLIKLIDSNDKNDVIGEMFIRESIKDKDIKESLFSKEAIRNQIHSLEKELSKIRTSEKIDRVLEREYINRLTSLKELLKEIDSEFDKKFPKFKFLMNQGQFNLNDIQNSLEINEKLFVYSSHENNLIIGYISRNDLQFKILEDKYDIILKDIQDLRFHLEMPNSQLSSFQVSQKLYSRLIKPFYNLISKNDKLIIINDEEISSIPFSALMDEDIRGSDYSEQSWLLKKYSFSYLPSLNALLLLKKLEKNKYVYDFTGIGNPDFNGIFEQLPNTEDEVHHISKYFDKDKINIFLGVNASESNLKNIPIDSKYLMFATHAVTANEVNIITEPAIVLTLNDGDEDGFLTTSEIINKKFNSELLLLSACNTAEPDLTGKYYSGLSRSFLYSGSKNLLLTLWSIETISAERITTKFFEMLDMSFSKGLRESQLILLKSKDYNHPFFWSPYIIIGSN